jgi:hypothetical protein
LYFFLLSYRKEEEEYIKYRITIKTKMYLLQQEKEEEEQGNPE